MQNVVIYMLVFTSFYSITFFLPNETSWIEFQNRAFFLVVVMVGNGEAEEHQIKI